MLTDEEIDRWCAGNNYAGTVPGARRFARTIESAACADRDARIAELERELEKEKQYVKEMTKDHHHWMTVAAERALLLDKNRKVNKPLSDYEFDEIG